MCDNRTEVYAAELASRLSYTQWDSGDADEMQSAILGLETGLQHLVLRQIEDLASFVSDWPMPLQQVRTHLSSILFNGRWPMYSETRTRDAQAKCPTEHCSRVYVAASHGHIHSYLPQPLPAMLGTHAAWSASGALPTRLDNNPL